MCTVSFLNVIYRLLKAVALSEAAYKVDKLYHRIIGTNQQFVLYLSVSQVCISVVGHISFMYETLGLTCGTTWMKEEREKGRKNKNKVKFLLKISDHKHPSSVVIKITKILLRTILYFPTHLFQFSITCKQIYFHFSRYIFGDRNSPLIWQSMSFPQPMTVIRDRQLFLHPRHIIKK